MKWIKNIGIFFFGMLMAIIILLILGLTIFYPINWLFDKMFPDKPNISDEFEDYVPGENIPYR